jgi:cytoplasmic iron level regulating protein YaaA (DUF328/UPF0246 family)
VLILLPPSEGKTGGGRGRPLDLDRLSFPALGPTRRKVSGALAEVSARSDATDVLGVSPGLASDVARNLELESAPTRAASRMYSGVLFDALDVAGMSAGARRRAHRWTVITSALFGAVRLSDPVVPYRLSMSVNLPGVGPLASAWRPALAESMAEAAGSGVVLDCRSSTYAAAWTPAGDQARRWVQVRVPGATHMAKHTRGLVARHLCETAAPVRHPADLLAPLECAFEVSLTEPARPGRPWVLSVSARNRSEG